MIASFVLFLNRPHEKNLVSFYRVAILKDKGKVMDIIYIDSSRDFDKVHKISLLAKY